MASFSVKVMPNDDIQLRMTKQLSQGFIMLFRVHHIVQQHPDHPDQRLTIKMSEELLDHVDFNVFLSYGQRKGFMSHVMYNILQLHSDSRGRFLSHRGDGVQVFLPGVLDNNPTPVDSEESFISLFHWYIVGAKIDYEKTGQRIVPIVIDCDIVRCHQCSNLDEAIAWWESAPLTAHDMVPATNSSPSDYATYKVKRVYGQAKPMNKRIYGGVRPEQCPICLEEFPLCRPIQVAVLYCEHTFHVPCITHWFKQSPTCPVCRFVLD